MAVEEAVAAYQKQAAMVWSPAEAVPPWTWQSSRSGSHSGGPASIHRGPRWCWKLAPWRPWSPSPPWCWHRVSSGAVIIMNNGEKLILASRNLVPMTSICDPSLTLGLPPCSLRRQEWMMTHCIEALLSPQINPPRKRSPAMALSAVFARGTSLKRSKTAR